VRREKIKSARLTVSTGQGWRTGTQLQAEDTAAHLPEPARWVASKKEKAVQPKIKLLDPRATLLIYRIKSQR